MGFKFNDILMKGHQGKQALNYFHRGDFVELFGDEIKSAHWEQKVFPAQKQLGIDRHDVCRLEDHHGNSEELILESNRKLAWIRLSIPIMLDGSKLVESLASKTPHALIAEFTYGSPSDTAFISIKKGQKWGFINWNSDTDQVGWTTDTQENVLKIPEDLTPIGEPLIAYYWKHLFPEIPLRYDLTLPSEALSEFLGQIQCEL